MTTGNRQGLRDCPFCHEGLPKFISVGQRLVGCINAVCPAFKIETNVEMWNSAYCWKEIDSLREQLKDTEAIADYLKKDNEAYEGLLCDRISEKLEVERQLKQSQEREDLLIEFLKKAMRGDQTPLWFKQSLHVIEKSRKARER